MADSIKKLREDFELHKKGITEAKEQAERDACEHSELFIRICKNGTSYHTAECALCGKETCRPYSTPTPTIVKWGFRKLLKLYK